MRLRRSRRDLLATAALAPLAATVPVMVLATTLAGEPDPHAAWHREWKACLDYCNGPDKPEVDTLDELPEWHRLMELEELIGATPARTMAGVRVQLATALYFVTGYLSLGDDGEAALTNALATLDRLDEGARS